jgi:hypothetical protein
MERITISVIGSFRQHYAQAVRAVKEFQSLGVTVASPGVSRIVNPGASFPRFETDSPQSPDQAIQAAAIGKIIGSDLAYVVAPGGYVGRTTCYELGWIHACDIPVYFSAVPRDLPIEVSSGSVLGVPELGGKISGMNWDRQRG